MKDEKIFEGISRDEARMKNPVILAFIGDTVYDLYVRTSVVKNTTAGINDVHTACVSMVNAKAQSEAAAEIEGMLTEEEKEIYRRGRNAKSGVPKNMTVSDYRHATGIEAVIGYLWLTADYGRLDELFEAIINGKQ